MEERKKTVVIADDHAIVRQGVRDVLLGFEGVFIAAEAENGLVAIAAVKAHTPDLLVVDAAMPLAKGIEVMVECQRWSPQTGTICLTGFTAAGILAQWVTAGVHGLLLKSCQPSEMHKAFEIVLNGGHYISPTVQTILDEAPALAELTSREAEVLSLLVSGHQNLTIADRLGISKRTVEKHRSNLMIKLDVTTISELMTYALREGLLDEHHQL